MTKEELRRSQIAVQSVCLAAELQNLGCDSQTVVGILSENKMEYLTAIVGIMLAGSPITFFNPAYTTGNPLPTIQI